MSTDKSGPGAGPEAGPDAGRELDPDLLSLLVCPETKAPLKYDKAKGELVSRQAGLAYPVVDGVPVLLKDRARRLGAHE